MEDPISDTQEVFRKKAARLVDYATNHANVDAVADALVEAYKFGLLMGAAAYKAFGDKKEDVWESDM